jgi:transposase
MPYRKVGVDLGLTGPHYVTVADEAGHLMLPLLTVETSAQDFDRIYEYALIGAEEGTQLKVIFEPTALRWLPLAIYTRAKGHRVYRVKTQQLHDLREFYQRYCKTDRLDSKAGAQMPDEVLEELYLPHRDYMALERTTRQQEKLTFHLQREEMRIAAIIDGFIPGLPRACGQPFSLPARVIYQQCANPFTIQAMGIERLRALINANSRIEINDQRLQAIWACVQNACDLYRAAHDYIDFDLVAREIQRYYQHVMYLERLLAEVENEVQTYYRRVHPSRNIETIYGIGKGLGPVFVSIIKDASRFRCASQIKGFIGMIPKIDASCSSSKKGLPITKEGPPRARRAGYLAAEVGRLWDPQLAKIYYDAMVHKGQTHTEALCAVSNHIFVRALRVLKEDRPYELRDLSGRPISAPEARAYIKEHLTVPEEIRRQRRNKKRVQERLARPYRHRRKRGRGYTDFSQNFEKKA